MPDFNVSRITGGALTLALALAAAACQQGAVQVESGNANASAANANAATNANANTDAKTEAAAIEAREPEQYRATLVFTATAEGKPQGIQLPVEVSRSGDNRRYAFNNVPVLGQVVFLDRADKRYLILPTRRQYAELTPELVGFDFRSLTPAQIVARLRQQQGVERVGEEQQGGRTVIKYRHAATARTTSQAGNVSTESFLLVDKDTGLPVHAELTGHSTGQVQGVNTAHVVADMKDIQTTSNAADFELPQGMQQLTAEQIKQQVGAMAAFLQIVLNGLQGQAGAAGAPPATTASPATTTASPATTTASPAPTHQ
jgi:hypothetical protein